MDVHLHDFSQELTPDEKMGGRGQVLASPSRSLVVFLRHWTVSVVLRACTAAGSAQELRTADPTPLGRIKSIVFEKKEINFIFST